MFNSYVEFLEGIIRILIYENPDEWRILSYWGSLQLAGAQVAGFGISKLDASERRSHYTVLGGKDMLYHMAVENHPSLVVSSG